MLKYLTNNASDGHWFLVMFMGWFLLSVYALHPLKLLILIMFSALDFISFSFCWWVRVSSTTNQLYPQNILLIFTLFRFLSVVYIKCEVWVFLFLFQRMRKCDCTLQHWLHVVVRRILLKVYGLWVYKVIFFYLFIMFLKICFLIEDIRNILESWSWSFHVLVLCIFNYSREGIPNLLLGRS